jgi:arylformamidase
VPLHIQDGGAAADQVALEACFGPALVRSFPVGRPITPADLEATAHQPTVPRLLFKGAESGYLRRAGAGGAGPLTEQAAGWLVERGVVLVGVDALSVDEYGSAELPAHRTLLSAGVLILEGLVLTSVAEGLYTLACFPIKIAEADGSPVRAVLVEPPLGGDH